MSSIVHSKLFQRDIPRDYETRAILEADAHEIADSAPEEYRQATYLYYLARYLVVVYEVYFAEIPIQVWNEYRNALDHFFRHLAGNTEATSDHIEKMEGHIQRAVLDVCKIICHDTEKRLNGRVAELDRRSLSLIDNGSFLSNLDAGFEMAKSCFIKAKTLDLALGDVAAHNNDTLSKYLDAVYSYIDVQNMLRDRRNAIDDASIRYHAIHHESAFDHVKLSLLTKVIWLALGALATFIIVHVATDDYTGVLTSWFKARS